jgi:hypothetical protein
MTTGNGGGITGNNLNVLKFLRDPCAQYERNVKSLQDHLASLGNPTLLTGAALDDYRQTETQIKLQQLKLKLCREPKPVQENPCVALAAEAFQSSDHFWQNWPKTHAYVAKKMFFPTTVYEIAGAVRAAEADATPVRAVGGGWSFSEASLPGDVATERPDAIGVEMLAQVVPKAASAPKTGPAVDVIDPQKAIDTFIGPTTVAALLKKSAPEPAYVINTRSLVSSLQQALPGLLSAEALDATSAAPHSGRKQRFYFHVEAGISIDELGQLLAHQSPRLTVKASGGDPGSTLAGALSTATHGAEFQWPLLIDRVKAIHLVGPGGLQWWIEGDDPVADPAKLQAAYPCLSPDRIISGTSPVHGVRPQDWLNAATVSLGCMGVVYSVVIEVFPLGGSHQCVIQRSWNDLLTQIGQLAGLDVPTFLAGLRDPNHVDQVNALGRFSDMFIQVLKDGQLNGTKIPLVDPERGNQYGNIAFNPVPLANGDFDCWIVNREPVPMPFDPQPSGGSDEIGDVVKGLTRAFADPSVVEHLLGAFGIKKPDPWVTAAIAFASTFLPLPTFIGPDPLASATVGSLAAVTAPLIQGIINLVANLKAMFDGPATSDLLDAILAAVFTPISNASAMDVAHAILTGFLSGLLGTANDARQSDTVGSSVGSLGFPGSGLMGTGIEIALAPKDAFRFLVLTVLDKLPRLRPFIGYISIRLNPPTGTLLGMQQFAPTSVMIEVVAFADQTGRDYVRQLQADTVAQMGHGLEAMLHWGLENDQLTGATFTGLASMQRPTSDDPKLRAQSDWLDPQNPPYDLAKFRAFGVVRDILRHGNGANDPAQLFRAFDNALTKRLGL